MKNLFLDIETIPTQNPAIIADLKAETEELKAAVRAPSNYKDSQKIAEYCEAQYAQIDLDADDRYRKTALDGSRGEVLCIGWSYNDEPVSSVERCNLNGSEEDVLGTFFSVLNPTHPVRFIGHCVRDFDLRFLYQRAVILGVRPPIRLPHDTRYNGDEVFDTMTGWAGWGNRISLARLCKTLGIAAKGTEIGEPIDGSKVWDYVQRGEIDKVAAYCRGDVERVRDVYRRMTWGIV